MVNDPPAMWETWVWEDPGLGRYPREEKGYPLQYSGLENSTDSVVHGVTESQTQLSDYCYNTLGFTCVSAGVTFIFNSLDSWT